MNDIEIICRAPGMRRCGVRHPASATYPADRWTDEQLAVFRADPMFAVREVPVTEEVARSAAAGDPGGVEAQLAVAPGADRSDEVFDNGAGPTINHLDAEPDGTGEAAAAPATAGSEVLGETVVPGGVAAPGTEAGAVFANDRIEAIRSAIADVGTKFDPTKPAWLRAVTKKLGFEPTPEELVAARVDAVAPEAVAKT